MEREEMSVDSCFLGCLKIIGVIAATFLLLWALSSCARGNYRTTNGHPNLYQKSKYQ